MALYNQHKRATLDRLTRTYQLRLLEVYRRDLTVKLKEGLAVLRDDSDRWEPRASKSLDESVYRLYAAHQKKAIEVGFSDGIQEVAPGKGDEPKLGAWERVPLGFPIEDSLSIELGKKRDGWSKEFIQDRRKPLAEKLREYTATAQTTYLKLVREEFGRAARRWLSGEEDVDMVRGYLQRSLQRNDYEAERILRTETTNYFNESRHSYFVEETSVDYVELYAVTDGRISAICNSRHGYVIPLDVAGQKKYMPAFHPHCRTIQRPLFSTIKSHLTLIKSGLGAQWSIPDDGGRGPRSESSFVPLPKGWA